MANTNGKLRYNAVGAPEWDALFVKHQPWGGGDGIYSYSIDKKSDSRLIVFGDTFYGSLGKDLVRLAPVAMPHNSLIYLQGKEPDQSKLTYNVKTGEKGRVQSYFVPQNELSQAGTGAGNLTIYHNRLFNDGWLSAYAPKENIELIFCFRHPETIGFLEIENYHVDGDETHDYEKRGVNQLTIQMGNHEEKIALKPYDSKNPVQTIKISGKVRQVSFIIPSKAGVGNFGGAVADEALFGLRKVRFFSIEDGYLDDVSCSASSEFISNDKHAWFWLQDGIIANDHYYSLPYVGIPDASQPEGFQFRIEGIAFVEVPLLNGKLDTDHINQRATNLYCQENGATYAFGAAVLDNSERDGFVYIYGNYTKPNESDKGRRMIVARVISREFADLNKWRYYDGKTFQRDILACAPILDHVSNECSISYDEDGYVAIFTVDTQGKDIAYAMGKTAYGPFDKPEVVYHCPEKVCPHLYQYNAKAHPALSKKGELLVSYNVNTSDFDENIHFGGCYGPRFFVLRKADN